MSFQSLFPDSRFVYIVRDPRAVVASRNKVPWSGGSNYHNAQVWRTYYQSGENLTPHVDNIFQLHYEQLVSSPMDILKELMVFLNLEYEESMLSFHHTSKDLVNVNREPWKAGITRPLSIDSITKWRKVLSKRAVYVIESTTYQGMKALGYERDYPDLSLLPGRILVFVFNVARKIKSFFSPIYRRLFPLPER